VKPCTPHRHRVVLQDRSRIFREGLKVLLETTSALCVEQVGEDADFLVEACQVSMPTAILLESSGVPWDVKALVDQLRSVVPHALLIGSCQSSHRHLEMSEGVTCLVRSSTSKEFEAALTGAPPEFVGIGRTHSDTTERSGDGLTPKEIQILVLISGGFTTQQIADRLGISAKTVENRRQMIFAKLNVQNQSHAVAVAMRAGLLGGESITVGSS